MTYNELNCVHQIPFFHKAQNMPLCVFQGIIEKLAAVPEWVGPWSLATMSLSMSKPGEIYIRRRPPLKLEVKAKVNWKSRKTKDCQKTPEIKRNSWKRIFTTCISESTPDSVLFISGVCLQNCFNQPRSQPPVCATLTGTPHKSDRICFLLGVHLFLKTLMTLLILSGNIALCVPKWIMSQDELCPTVNYIPLFSRISKWMGFAPNSVSRHAQCRQMNRWMCYGKKS